MAISPALAALFNTIIATPETPWCSWDLYTITLANAQILRYTTADFDINCGSGLNFNGLPNPAGVYASTGVRVDQDSTKGTKTQAHFKVGLDTDTWVVCMMPRYIDPVTGVLFPDTIGSVPWIQAADAGYLDAADFQVDRAYFSSIPTWPMPPGGMVPTATRTIFAGVVAEVDTTDVMAILTINDYRVLFTQSMPRRFYQSQCGWTLFGPGCNADGLARATFAVNGVVGAGSTSGTIVAPGLATPGGSGTYALGTVIMTSGLNNTFERTVTSWGGNKLQLLNPFPFTLEPGDTFSAAPGCNWLKSTCTDFGNELNFGGFDRIPVPETIA